MTALVVAQLLLAAGVVPLWFLRSAAIVPASSLRVARALVLASLVLPWLPLSSGVEIRVPVQAVDLWPGTPSLLESSVTDPVLEPSLRPELERARRLALGLWCLLAAAAALATMTAGGSLFWRLHRTTRLRRIGRVDVRVGRTPTPFAVWWPGAALVVLDPTTAAHVERRRIAVAHELQHHRSGDTRWAWLLLGLTVAFPWNPAVWLWARGLRELEEMAVDARMLRRFPRRLYASCLIDTAAAAHAFAPSLAARSTVLTRRIHMMHRLPRPAFLAPLVGALALFALSAVAVAGGSHWRPSPSEAERLAQMASHSGFTASAHPVVTERLQSLAGTRQGRWFVKGALERRDTYQALVDGALQEAGLPPQLTAIPLVESGYRNMGEFEPGMSAAPGIPGKGLWMFIPSTARTYGLRVDTTVDERLDVVAETDAAVRLLSDLHGQFGDWALAIAGYNMGARAVRQAIEEEGTRNAFDLADAGALNDYVATTYAAVLILEDPVRFGF